MMNNSRKTAAEYIDAGCMESSPDQIPWLRRWYPGHRCDGTRAFYDWVREATQPETVMLNLGAGSEVGPSIRCFKGEVARVIGADIDRAVLKNKGLDEAYVVGKTLPFPPAHFDLVLSDFVLEHVEAPAEFLGEVYRVLKPGGSFFFRTPNRFHYVSLIARFTPHFVHEIIVDRVQGRKHEDVFPTFYRLNSRASVRREARSAGFDEIELRMFEPEPAYLVFNRVPFVIGVAYERVVNSSDALAGLRCNIFGRFTR